MQHCFHLARHPTLLALEAAVVELQSPAVFGDYPYDLVRCAVGDVDFYLQGQPDVGSHHSGQVSDHLTSYHAGVTSQPGGIELD